MKTLFISALAMLLATATLRAQSVDALLTQGVDQLYNVRFDEAAKSFDRAIQVAPNDPRGYFYRANVHLWSYLFDRRESQLALYMDVSQKAITRAESAIKANGRDSRAKVYLGMAYGYRAIAHARAENITSAAMSAKTCYDKLNEVVKSDAKQYDAYLGLGIFHFIFGSVPKAAQMVAGFSGIKGDAKLGIKEIEIAANRGTLFRNDAQLTLALLQIYYLNDVSKGLSMLEGMANRFPKNVAILYAIGSAYLDQNKPDKAVAYFDRVVGQGNNDFKTFTNMSYGRAGSAFFARNDFARAKTYLEKFLRLSQDKGYRAYAWYLLGLSLEMTGARANAVKAYDRALSSPRTQSPEDQLARRKSAELKARAMTAADMDIVRAINAGSASDYNGAISYATSAINRGNLGAAQAAQAHYAIGQGYQGKGDWNKAIASFQKAISYGNHTERWVAPFSYFHIAECYLKLGNRAKWQSNIESAKRYDGYDNELMLRFKIERDVTTID